MSETSLTKDPDYADGFFDAQSSGSLPGDPPLHDDRTSQAYVAGWNAFMAMRDIYLAAGFVQKDGGFFISYPRVGQ